MYIIYLAISNDQEKGGIKVNKSTKKYSSNVKVPKQVKLISKIDLGQIQFSIILNILY